MEITKIRMKVGDHEFEAEGPAEMVQAQFEAFRSLLSIAPIKTEPPSAQEPVNPVENTGNPSHVRLDRIMRAQGRVVSLTAIPDREEDSALLILLGNKEMRANESVTGSEVGDGLAQSGRPVNRTDRVMEKLISENYVLKSGFRRGTRYRLSNIGHQKALAVARELIASLP